MIAMVSAAAKQWGLLDGLLALPAPLANGGLLAWVSLCPH
jgi:hypothetical protein